MNYKFINNRLEEIHSEYYSHYWDNLINNTLNKMENIKERQSSFYFDKEINNFVKQQFKSSKDEIEIRKFDLLEKHFAQKRVENDPELIEFVNKSIGIMTEDSFEYQGKKFRIHDLYNKIVKSKNKEERDYYLKIRAKIYNQCKELIINIVKRRNYLAKFEGYESFVDLYLSNKDITKEELFKLIENVKDELINRTKKERVEQKIKDKNEGFKLYKKYFSNKNIYSYFDELLKQWGIGFNNEKITWKDGGDNPIQRNICESVPVSIPNDIRAYVHSNKTISDNYYVVFHEYGHALHESNIMSKEYIFKIVSPMYSETMATLVDKLLSLKESLGQIINNSEDIKIISEINTGNNYNIYLSNCIRTLLEMELYLNEMTIEDVDNYFQKLIYGWTGKKDRTDWGDNIFSFAQFPLNNYTYFLGHIISNQIIGYIYKKFNSYLKPEVFQFINKNYYNKGNEIPWKRIIKETTGNAYNSNYFFKRVQDI